MNARILVTMLAAVVVFPGSVSAQSSGRRPGSSDGLTARRARRSSDTGDLARASLLKLVEEVDWLESTFEEVIEWLVEQGDDKVNVIPRWRALSEVGVEPDSLVTLKIRNVSVAEVLNEVFDQLSDDGVLRYVATKNIIRITTQRVMQQKMETRAYSVTDLIFLIPDMAESAPVVDLQAASRQSSGGGSGQSVFQGGGSQGAEDLEDDDQDREERLEDLKTVIEAHIEPNSWVINGGLGQVTIVNERQLVVTNTITVHEKIGGFLSRVR